jgi:hypothetical protein
MKKYRIVWFFIYIGMNPVLGQGFEADPQAYNKMPQVAHFEPNAKLDGEIFLEHRLRKYCPPPTHQRNAPSCVFQSLCYGAMSIMYNIQSERDHPTDETAFSALYGYNQVSHCDNTRFQVAIDFLKAKGTPFIMDFEKKDRDNCQLQPNETHHRKASAYKLKDALILFDTNTPLPERRIKLKRCISEHKPLAVGMFLPPSFEYYNGLQEYYIYKSPYSKPFKHAMVVIGYDEYSVELMNSYGPKWGKGGFVKILHDDFFKYCKEAYQLIFEPVQAQQQLSGQFEFRTPVEGQMKPIDFKFQAGRYYESDCVLGQQFQLAATELQANKYVYVFSEDPNGKVMLHWPRNRKNKYGLFELLESPVTPVSYTHLTLPTKP